jgi:hypothetical protein
MVVAKTLVCYIKGLITAVKKFNSAAPWRRCNEPPPESGRKIEIKLQKCENISGGVLLILLRDPCHKPLWQ